jgi:hypothetical protein
MRLVTLFEILRELLQGFARLFTIAFVSVPAFLGAMLLQEAVSRNDYIEAFEILAFGVALMLVAYCVFPDDDVGPHPVFRIGRLARRRRENGRGKDGREAADI